MSSTVIDSKREGQAAELNGIDPRALEGRPALRFHDGLGDHPLWQALMDEIEANRQADIAEQTRLADLELEK